MAQDRNDQIASLYRASYDKMCRVAYRLVGDYESAKELVQDTFLLTLFHQDELSAHPNPEAWLMLSLKNLCKNANQRMSSTEISLETLLHIPASGDEHSLLEALPSQLSERDKMILIWRFEERLDYMEIADRLGVSESGSRSCVFRAIARCKKMLGDKALSS